MSIAEAYRSTRLRLLDLAADLTPHEAEVTVPPTPAWSVRDTYAHIVGAVVDVLDGNTDGFGTEEWTAAHVSARRRASLVELCEEYAQRAPEYERRLEVGDVPMLVAGTWTHEQDIRGSLGLKGVGDTGGMEAVLDQVDSIGPRIAEQGIPALRIVAGDRQWTLGPGVVGATLTTSPYVVARLVYGRRSPTQVRELDWDADPEPYLPLLGHYGLAAVDIHD